MQDFVSIRPALAEAKSAENSANAPVDSGLSYLSGTLAMDMARFDLDKPLPPDLPVQGMISKLPQYTQAKKDMALREIAKHEMFPICSEP